MELPNVGFWDVSDDTGALEHSRLRLCHIDVDVFGSASQTFAWAWPRRRGRIVVFDD